MCSLPRRVGAGDEQGVSTSPVSSQPPVWVWVAVIGGVAVLGGLIAVVVISLKRTGPEEHV